MRSLFDHVFGAVLGIGLIPVVPATWTSLAVALALWATQAPVAWQIAALVLFLVTGVPACSGLERRYGEDPKQATADEAAGQIITLLALPLDLVTVMVGFFLFRLFDVVKPPPARRFEDFGGGWGIMADDVMAGIYAWVVLFVYVRFVSPVVDLPVILPSW
jgi:phosphatidylglycerophosphatase A